MTGAKIIAVRMAKASAADIDAAHSVASIVEDLHKGHYPARPDDDNAPRHFDEDDSDHLRALYDRLIEVTEPAPGGLFRVAGGMHCILSNDILDPDDDCLELHPRLKGGDLSTAVRADERAFMQLLADRIAANASPEQESRLQVAFAIARHLGLDWPSAYRVDCLWCLHILGPDDVHPAPSKAHAEKAAELFNATFPQHEDVPCKAVAAPWPHSAESHAEDVGTFIETWLIPGGPRG